MKPNFVFIVADDLGYADLGCYSRDGAPSCSPHLDRLAAEGMRFTDGYSNSAVCSPTRFALATGRWQYRFRGAADEPLAARLQPGRPALGLPPEHPTLASLLRDAGYATALIGKWHLGPPPLFGPLKSGYGEFFGAIGGGLDYFTHCDMAGRHDLYENEREVFAPGYLTDLLSEKAKAFIERHKDRPFLLSLHYTAPHWPWETRADEAESKAIGNIAHFDGGSSETYRTMIHHMDEGIGRLMDALRAAGVVGRTLVVFTSDNGGERFSDNWPLTGGKMDLLEGGIRVPYIARWPGRIAPGAVTPQLTITMDWVATFLDAAGVEPQADHPLDGRSMLPVFEGRGFERDLFWRMKHRQQKAVRSGRWKYLSLEGNEFLFDLALDPKERANRAQREPELLPEMKARYDAWEKTVQPIPEDARVSVLAGPAQLARPS